MYFALSVVLIGIASQWIQKHKNNKKQNKKNKEKKKTT